MPRPPSLTTDEPLWSLGAAIAITLAIVFVMVVKPTLY